ncbi:hypothetical protein FOA52_002876 [Chlamydomonas sp. UWO 241]|nr:hypothetical protein FOA52_002876 [Chlamydomonas sp. UWO 241]
MPGLEFLSPVSAHHHAPMRRGEHVSHGHQASLVWLGFLRRCQMDASGDCLVLPSCEEIAALCAAGHAEHLLEFVQRRLQASLKGAHAPAFWSRLTAAESAWAARAQQRQQQSGGDDACSLREGAGEGAGGCKGGGAAGEGGASGCGVSGDAACDQELADALVGALAALASPVDAHCALLDSLGSQLLACHRPQPPPASAADPAGDPGAPDGSGAGSASPWGQPQPMDITPAPQQPQQQAAAAAPGSSCGGGGGWDEQPRPAAGMAAAPPPAFLAKLPALSQRHRALAAAVLQADPPADLQALLRALFSGALHRLRAACSAAAAAAAAAAVGGTAGDDSLATDRVMADSWDGASGASAAVAVAGGGVGWAGNEVPGAAAMPGAAADAAASEAALVAYSGGQESPSAAAVAAAASAAAAAVVTGSSAGWAGQDSPSAAAVAAAAAAAAAAVVTGSGGGWAGQVASCARCLHSLELGGALEEAATCVVYEHVQGTLERLAKGVLDREVLPEALKYVQAVPLHFLGLLPGAGQQQQQRQVLQQQQQPSASSPSSLAEEWRLRLAYLVYEGLGATRIRQLFDIIVDYPDSAPALEDIRTCLRHTSLQSHVVSVLGEAISRRLLHAGVPAASIIHTYISTIKALSSVEPSGALLAAVAEPIRRYLRSRPDAIKVLVAMVTQGGTDEDDGGGGLSLRQELQQQASVANSRSAELSAGDPDDAVLRDAEAEEPDEEPGAEEAGWARAGAGGAGAGARTGAGSSARTGAAGIGGGGASASGAPGRAAGSVAGSRGESAAAAAAARDARAAGPLAAAAPGRGAACTGTGAAGQLGGSQLAAAGSQAVAAGGDIIGLLIGVFGSVDVFISEYRSVMAAQLLTASGFDCEATVCTTELLKLRFGEQALHAIEVMLKDVADSKRACTSIQAAAAAAAAAATAAAEATQPPIGDDDCCIAAAADAMCTSELDDADGGGGGAQPGAGTEGDAALPEEVEEGEAEDAPLPLSSLSAAIVSRLFWPGKGGGEQQGGKAALSGEEKLVLPGEVLKAMEEYGSHYTALKTPRLLRWRAPQGVVDLDVDISGLVVHARVSPTLAALLLAFRSAEAMSVAQLAAAVGLPQAIVRRKISFWVNHGLVVEARGRPAEGAPGEPTRRLGARGGGVRADGGAAGARGAPALYRRAARLDAAMHGETISDEGAEDEAPTSVAGAQDALLDVMAPYENYIMGMLTTYKQMPLDRLNHMLKLFVISPKYDKSADQLAAFLSHLVAQGKVVLENSVYRRPAAPPPPSET